MSGLLTLENTVIGAQDAFGGRQPCRVLIDSGAQSNFISISCLQRLGLPQRKCSFNIFGLAGEGIKNHGMTSCVIKPRHSNEFTFNIDAVVLPKITSDLPNVQVPQHVVKEFSSLFLADPNFYKKSSIDFILAGDIFPHIYDGKKIVINADTPVALSSVFGYVITGKLSGGNLHKNQLFRNSYLLRCYEYNGDFQNLIRSAVRACGAVSDGE